VNHERREDRRPGAPVQPAMTTHVPPDSGLVANLGAPTMAMTRAILDRHLAAFFSYDLKGVMADYDKDIVFFTAEGPLIGVDAVQPLFEKLIGEFRQPGARFTIQQFFVEGDHGYLLWTAETTANVYEMATDTFVVRNGRIAAQSFTASVRPKQ
jgi:ketosteroid isomerase-like protein